MAYVMTEKGTEVFHTLNDRANRQIEDLISKLNIEDCEKLIASMRTVKKYFSKAAKDIKIRPYQE